MAQIKDPNQRLRSRVEERQKEREKEQKGKPER